MQLFNLVPGALFSFGSLSELACCKSRRLFLFHMYCNEKQELELKNFHHVQNWIIVIQYSIDYRDTK